MKAPHGATHREVGTNNYLRLTPFGICRHNVSNGWTLVDPQPKTSNFVALEPKREGVYILIDLIDEVFKPQTLQERLTAILCVETDEDIVVHVKALHDAAQEQETTYWDGVEPLRVGHVTNEGEVTAVHITAQQVSVANDIGMWTCAYSTQKPHPLATLSDPERELVNNLIEAGVVCLPS